MTRSAIALVVALLLGGAPGRADAAISVLNGVPSYLWYYGCGPTALGMIVGYWDANGYPNFIPGDNAWQTNQQAIKNVIASSGHIRDYSSTPDRKATSSDPYHADDCIADFIGVSRDPLVLGSSYITAHSGLTRFASLRGYTWGSGIVDGAEAVWDELVARIDAGQPLELLVDTDGDAATDHFVTAIGYDSASNRYACYDTWSRNVRWTPFHGPSDGDTWGVASCFTFFPEDGGKPGDINADGLVNMADFQILSTYYGRKNMTLENGDLNHDGWVNVGDLGILAGNMNFSGGGLAPEAAAIPEPATVVLMATLGLGLMWRRSPGRRSGRVAKSQAGRAASRNDPILRQGGGLQTTWHRLINHFRMLNLP